LIQIFLSENITRFQHNCWFSNLSRTDRYTRNGIQMLKFYQFLIQAIDCGK